MPLLVNPYWSFNYSRMKHYVSRKTSLKVTVVFTPYSTFALFFRNMPSRRQQQYITI